MTPVDEAGALRMRNLVRDLPAQLSRGFTIGRNSPFAPKGQGPLLLLGIGGSSIAGDLLSAYANQKGSRPLLTSRSFSLPAWAGPGMPAIAVSYSGNTAETLQAFREAKRRGLDLGVVTSGGELAKEAREAGIPNSVVPGGLPPRAAVGLLLGALCGMLSATLGPSPSTFEAAVHTLESQAPEMTSPKGRAHGVAEAWKDRELMVYVSERLTPIGRRWKTQSEENAKHLGHFDTIPELLHNAIVAWDTLSRAEAERRAVAIVHGPLDPPEVERRCQYLKGALEDRGARVVDVRLSATEPLAELFEGLWIGDHASLVKADSLGIDPIPIRGIEKMRAEMAR